MLADKPTIQTSLPFHELSIMVFGTPSSGKTSFCNDGKDTLFLATFPTQKEQVFARVENMASWEDFKSKVHEIIQLKIQGQLPITSVVLDIIDNLWNYCLTFICATKNLKYPPTTDFGKTWQEINMEFLGVLDSLMRVIPVRIISHAETSEVMLDNNGVQEAVSQASVTFKSGKQVQAYLKSVLDAVGYMQVNAHGQHTITFVPNAYSQAKDRTEILKRCGVIVLPDDSSLGLDYVGKYYYSVAEQLGRKIVSKKGVSNGQAESQGESQE